MWQSLRTELRDIEERGKRLYPKGITLAEHDHAKKGKKGV
jgi:hypothetical protein